jgi:hypothetical protein
MKRRGVQRAVKVQRFDRAAGDLPSLGHLERMPGTGLPPEKRRKKRRRDGRRGSRRRDRKLRRKVIVVWSVVLVVVSLVVLGVAVGYSLWPVKDRAAETAAVNAAAGGGSRVAERFQSPTREAAMESVKQALMVRDAAMVGGFFRLGSASPEAVTAFLRDMERVDGPVTGCVWKSSMDANGLLLEGVSVITQQGGKPRNRLALLTPDEYGKWKIDFAAFARSVKPAWSEIMSMAAGEGLVRVVVAKDNYYNGPFKDEARWSCYGMASPDEPVVMLGYCRRDSPQDIAMARLLGGANPLASDRGLRRATLEIRRVDGAESRQFEITRVLAEDWVVSATPFDETNP